MKKITAIQGEIINMKEFASAFDPIEGDNLHVDISDRITFSEETLLAEEGIYPIQVNATDSQGNSAEEKTISVRIRDYTTIELTREELIDKIIAWAKDPVGNNILMVTYANTSAVTDMGALFNPFAAHYQSLSDNEKSLIRSFNLDISKWQTGSVTDMSAMFTSSQAFNVDISSWDVGKVTNTYAMFSNAVAFNQDLSTWDTKSLRDVRYMFANSHAFNQDLSSWDVSNVIYHDNFAQDAALIDVFNPFHIKAVPAYEWVNTRIPTQQGIREIQLEATPSRGNIDAIVALSLGDAVAYGDTIMSVSFKLDEGVKKVRVINFNQYLSTNSFLYEDLKTYEIRVLIDFVSHKYYVYIKEKGDTTETLLASGFRFREHKTDASSVDTLAEMSTTSAMIVKYISSNTIDISELPSSPTVEAGEKLTTLKPEILVTDASISYAKANQTGLMNKASGFYMAEKTRVLSTLLRIESLSSINSGAGGSADASDLSKLAGGAVINIKKYIMTDSPTAVDTERLSLAVRTIDVVSQATFHKLTGSNNRLDGSWILAQCANAIILLKHKIGYNYTGFDKFKNDFYQYYSRPEISDPKKWFFFGANWEASCINMTMSMGILFNDTDLYYRYDYQLKWLVKGYIYLKEDGDYPIYPIDKIQEEEGISFLATLNKYIGANALGRNTEDGWRKKFYYNYRYANNEVAEDQVFWADSTPRLTTGWKFGAVAGHWNDNGIVMENFRDQYHALLGVECLAMIVLMKHNQGETVDSDFINRVSAAGEMSAKLLRKTGTLKMYPNDESKNILIRQKITDPYVIGCTPFMHSLLKVAKLYGKAHNTMQQFVDIEIANAINDNPSNGVNGYASFSNLMGIES